MTLYIKYCYQKEFYLPTAEQIQQQIEIAEEEFRQNMKTRESENTDV